MEKVDAQFMKVMVFILHVTRTSADRYSMAKNANLWIGTCFSILAFFAAGITFLLVDFGLQPAIKLGIGITSIAIGSFCIVAICFIIGYVRWKEQMMTGVCIAGDPSYTPLQSMFYDAGMDDFSHLSVR